MTQKIKNCQVNICQGQNDIKMKMVQAKIANRQTGHKE